MKVEAIKEGFRLVPESDFEKSYLRSIGGQIMAVFANEDGGANVVPKDSLSSTAREEG